MSKELIERLRELSASRKPYATGAHGQIIGMESYRIVANGFALECIEEAADHIEELERERDAFYMGYRMKCDEEAKDSALVIIERDQLREKVKTLSAWIKQQGEITDTCTFNLLREVCENCACHRNKALAATEPGSTNQDKAAIFKALGLVPWDNKPPACTDTVWIEPGKIGSKG